MDPTVTLLLSDYDKLRNENILLKELLTKHEQVYKIEEADAEDENLIYTIEIDVSKAEDVAVVMASEKLTADVERKEVYITHVHNNFEVVLE